MVWWVDEYIEQTLKKIDLCPGVDITLTFNGSDGEEDIDVYIFWSKPNTSTDWYPICQIDKGCVTVFHMEGSENEEHWKDLLIEAANKATGVLNNDH